MTAVTLARLPGCIDIQMNESPSQVEPEVEVTLDSESSLSVYLRVAPLCPFGHDLPTSWPLCVPFQRSITSKSPLHLSVCHQRASIQNLSI
jgi:hypothetical protein